MRTQSLQNGIPTKPCSSRASVEHFVGVLGVVKKVMGRCTAQCEMQLFRATTIVRDSDNTELAHLKKKEKHFARFASSWFSTLAMLSRATGRLVGHENTQRLMVLCYKGS